MRYEETSNPVCKCYGGLNNSEIIDLYRYKGEGCIAAKEFGNSYLRLPTSSERRDRGRVRTLPAGLMYNQNYGYPILIPFLMELNPSSR